MVSCRQIEIETTYIQSVELVWFRLVSVVRLQAGSYRFDTQFETGMQQLAFHTGMAAALRRFFRRRHVADPVAEPVTWISCPCTNPDEKQFPVVHLGDTLRGEFELPTARDSYVEWLLFSYT